jgi:hypothetical protein
MSEPEATPAQAAKSYPALLWHDIKSRKSEFFVGLLLSILSSVATVWLQYRDGMLEQKHFWDGIVTSAIPVLGIVVVFALVEVYRAAASLHREGQAKIKELETRAHGTKLSLPTETAEERLWNLRYQAEAPELAMKILTGPKDSSEPKPYLAIEYVSDWRGYVMEYDPDEEEHFKLEEFFKLTNASNEVIREIQIEPFMIWGVKICTESVPTLIHREPVKQLVRKIAEQLKNANIGLRAFHKKPVGVPLTVTYYGQSDRQYLGRHALVYDKGNIRVEPLIDGAEVDWLDATEIVVTQDVVTQDEADD